MKYPIETRIFKCSDGSEYEDRLTAQLVQANLDLEHLLKNEIPKNETGWMKQEHINEMKRITEAYEHILQRQNEKKREIEGEGDDKVTHLEARFASKVGILFQDERVRSLLRSRWDRSSKFLECEYTDDLIRAAFVWDKTEEGAVWWFDVAERQVPELRIKELKGWT
jgi:hypothetical protein